MGQSRRPSLWRTGWTWSFYAGALILWIVVVWFLVDPVNARATQRLNDRLPEPFHAERVIDETRNPRGLTLGMPGDRWSHVWVFSLSPHHVQRLEAEGLDGLQHIDEWPIPGRNGRVPGPSTYGNGPAKWDTTPPAGFIGSEGCYDDRTGETCDGFVRTILFGSGERRVVDRLNPDLEDRVNTALTTEGGYIWFEQNRLLAFLPKERLGVFAWWHF